MREALQKWNQIVVVDPSNLSGDSVAAFMRALMAAFDFKWVAVRDVSGAFSGSHLTESDPIPDEVFLHFVKLAVQFDWAFFFLYRNFPSPNILSGDDTKRIWSADVTVRLADDTYFYVYTLDDRVATFLASNFECTTTSRLSLSLLNVLY